MSVTTTDTGLLEGPSMTESEVEFCAQAGHAFHGVDCGVGSCYCGQREYPQFSHACDACGLPARSDGLIKAGQWPDGSPFRVHPSCADREQSERAASEANASEQPRALRPE